MKMGGFNIISTASRVLRPAEQRYTTCEQELLAIIYALQRFKFYIYGRKVVLFADNEAVTFLHKCGRSTESFRTQRCESHQSFTGESITVEKNYFNQKDQKLVSEMQGYKMFAQEGGQQQLVAIRKVSMVGERQVIQEQRLRQSYV